jgi:hypothetical protein
MGVKTVNLRCIRKTVNIFCGQHVVTFGIKTSGISQEHDTEYHTLTNALTMYNNILV